MIRNRYNYPTPPIRDIKGKETQTRNNWTLMETSQAESQTDSYFPTKWPHSYPKQKVVSDTHIQRRTITKINHDRRTALERSVKSISLGGGGAGGGGGGGCGEGDLMMCKHHAAYLRNSMTQGWPQNQDRSQWPTFHGRVILPYILKNISQFSDFTLYPDEHGMY